MAQCNSPPAPEALQSGAGGAASFQLDDIILLPALTLRVLLPQGGVALPVHQFTFYRHPQLISVSPCFGDSAGRGTIVKISGKVFFGGGTTEMSMKSKALCSMKGSTSDVHILSDSEIECEVSCSGGSSSTRNGTDAAYASGFVGVLQVSLNDGIDFTPENDSPIFTCPALPTVTGVKPLYGTEKGSTPLLVSGNNLEDWIATVTMTDASGPVLACSFSSPGISNFASTTLFTAAVHVSRGIVRCHSPPGAPGTSVEVGLVLSRDDELGVDDGIIVTALGTAEFSFVPSTILSSVISQSTLVIEGSGFLENSSFPVGCFVNDTPTYAEVLSPTSIHCGLPPGWLGGPAVISVSSNGVDSEDQLVTTGLPPAPTLWAVLPPRGVVGGGTRVQVVASFPTNYVNSFLLSEEEEEEGSLAIMKCKFGNTVVNASVFRVSDVSSSKYSPTTNFEN